ncbi:hypothetical protein, partial [Kitasatospora sp. NPDC001225]
EGRVLGAEQLGDPVLQGADHAVAVLVMQWVVAVTAGPILISVMRTRFLDGWFAQSLALTC